jgi:ring-1,2-phenylacetyl-CoA epoxidase subunit PaaB
VSRSEWPRFVVLQQTRPDRPHEAVGSVHAADAEMALMSARDVYARRPRVFNAWVVPEEAVFARTAEELAKDESWREMEAPAGASPTTYLVCQKQSQRRSMTYVTHVGDVEARTPQEALARALDTFDRDDVYVWWVFPAAAVTANREEDVESWFDPARDKTYRQQSAYGFVGSRRRRGRRRRGQTSKDESES